MKILRRPLVIVSALITVTLLLSWRYFDDPPPAAFSQSLFASATNTLMQEENWLALMGDNAASDSDDQQQPPAAEDVLLQRIPGDNMHVLIMAYYSKENYSQPSFTIDNGYSITLRDDGKGADKKAADGLYTARIPADVQGFRQQAGALLQQMKANGYKPIRYLHRQMVLDPDAGESFDLAGFEAQQPVSISALTNALSGDFSTTAHSLIGANSRSSSSFAAAAAAAPVTTKPKTIDSIRQNSILITDLAVVEDPTRTWNSCTQKGKLGGPWTFNTLMRQLASKSPSQPASNARVSAFVKNWLNTWAGTQVINGDTVLARTLVNTQILDPWLTKSKNNGFPDGQLDMRFAPFKLTAIVNRFDLRDGEKQGVLGRPCGEARFVFCLIKSDCSRAMQMTAIFEYGINKPKTCESQHAWAQQWVNLKNFPIGSSQYNQALQKITNQFTLCGSNPSRPNQSSLDQIRTNEVALSPVPKIWEFREFVLDSATSSLKETTVGQTPADRYNVQVANADVQRMTAYVNNHATWIKTQRNVVPLKFQGFTFLGGTSRVNGSPIGTPPNVYYWNGTDSTNKPTFIVDNNARFSFSLQTCSGCHAGETQTDFTHIDVAFYGQKAGLSGFLTGKAGSGGAIDFDNDSTNSLMTVRDAAARPSPSKATLRTFNDIDARARALKSFVSTTCGSVLSVSSQLMFQPTNMVH